MFVMLNKFRFYFKMDKSYKFLITITDGSFPICIMDVRNKDDFGEIADNLTIYILFNRHVTAVVGIEYNFNFHQQRLINIYCYNK